MNVIISPVITEKSMQDAGSGKFTFRVAKSANKNEIKKAIEGNFKVNVVRVSTNILKGRKIRVGARRTEKSLSNVKKAVVTLKEGQKIGLFELGDTKDGK